MSGQQRFVFDGIAELYDRVRPGYPAALIDAVLDMVSVRGGPVALEVGCGSGQASLPFAERGVAITALEPGPRMAALARRKLESFPLVRIEEVTFEDWPLQTESFDLIYSAQAFHWVTPRLRFTKAARALRRGGVLALIGNIPQPAAGDLGERIQAAYRKYAASLSSHLPGSGRVADGRLLRDEFAESGDFEAPAARVFAWRHTYDSVAYCDLMRTQSDHALLPAADLTALCGAIRAVIDDHGGHIEVEYRAHLRAARRIG